VFSIVARLADEGADFGLMLAGLTDALRAELATTLGGVVGGTSERMRTALEATKGRFSTGDLLRMLNIVVELEPHFKRSAQQQLLLETLLVRFALLDRTVDLEAVLKGMPAAAAGGLAGGTASGSGGASTGPRCAEGGACAGLRNGGRCCARSSAGRCRPAVAPR
jgi:DNA polymerase-3 subunit gamma/tau